MSKVILLDARPLGLLTNPRGGADAVGCYSWMQALLESGIRFVVSEISDYEVRRELIRIGSDLGLERLDLLVRVPGVEYAPLTTTVMRQAAQYWATARRHGRPTAHPQALDCDMILAAQAVVIKNRGDDVVVATTNVRHLALFTAALRWTEIREF